MYGRVMSNSIGHQMLGVEMFLWEGKAGFELAYLPSDSHYKQDETIRVEEYM